MNHAHGSLESVGGDVTGPVCHAPSRPDGGDPRRLVSLKRWMKAPAPPVVRGKGAASEITAKQRRRRATDLAV